MPGLSPADTKHAKKDIRIVLILVLALGVVVLIHVFSPDESFRTYTVQATHLRIDSLNQILPLKDSLVVPILYSNVSGLEQLPVSSAKDLFISALLPAILVAKHKLQEDKRKIEHLLHKKKWNAVDSALYHQTKAKFRASDPENLLMRIGSLPNSIVLAQAAVESGWGQSRFFLEGNNVFGIWSYNANEPRIKAGMTRDSTVIYVRAYDNMAQSIEDYFETLASARAYRNLRTARLQTDDPFELLTHLQYYSERRSHYTNQLATIIRQNDLTRYDHYMIDPTYLVEE